MKISLVSLVFSIALLQCVSTTLAAPSKLKGAKRAPEKQVRSLKKGQKHRECTSSAKKNEVKFECRSSSSDELETRGIFLEPDDEIRDKIKYNVKADKQGVTVKVEYKQEFDEDGSDQKGMENVTETKTQFEVAFDRIVEYAKPGDEEERSDEDQAYDWEQDQVLQTFDLAEWGAVSSVRDDDDGIISHFSVYSEDMVVMFNFTIARTDIGGQAKANTMKIDILIADFPWMRNDTNLALLSTVNSKLKVKMEYDEEATAREEHNGHLHYPKRTKDVQIAFDDATDVIGSAPFGKYAWKDLADATSDIALETDEECEPAALVGRAADLPTQCRNYTASELVLVEEMKQTIRVVATSPPQLGNETFQAIAYSFVGRTAHHASEIYWDPEAGIGYGSDGEEDLVGFDEMDSAATSVFCFASISSALVAIGMSILSS